MRGLLFLALAGCASAPTRVPLPGKPWAIQARAEVAYVIAAPERETKKLVVIDLAEGTVRRTLDVAPKAIDLDVSDGTALIAAQTSGIQIVDLDSAESRTVAVAGNVSDIRAYGAGACAVVDGAVCLIDLASGAATMKLEMEGVPGGLEVSGDTAYFSHAYPGGFQAIDLRARVLLATVKDTPWLVSAKRIGDRVYCKTSNPVPGFCVFDSQRNVLLETYGEFGVFSDTDGENVFVVNGETLSVLTLDAGRPVASVEVPGSRDVRVIGDRVFVWGDDFIEIRDRRELTRR